MANALAPNTLIIGHLKQFSYFAGLSPWFYIYATLPQVVFDTDDEEESHGAGSAEEEEDGALDQALTEVSDSDDDRPLVNMSQYVVSEEEEDVASEEGESGDEAASGESSEEEEVGHLPPAVRGRVRGRHDDSMESPMVRLVLQHF